LGSRRELTYTSPHHVIRHGEIQIPCSAHHIRMHSSSEPSRMSRQDHRHPARFVRIGLGMLVRKQHAGAVQNVSVAFRSGLQLRQQKSSGGNRLAGVLRSESKSRTVLLYWL
jgi:hypothetical protein